MNKILALVAATVLTSVTAAALAQSTDAPARTGIARTPPTVEEITARLQARGLTDAQISERLAALQAAIAAGERPIPTRPVRTPPTRDELVAKLRAEGLTDEQITARLAEIEARAGQGPAVRGPRPVRPRADG